MSIIEKDDALFKKILTTKSFISSKTEEFNHLHDDVVKRMWDDNSILKKIYCTRPLDTISIDMEGNVAMCCESWIAPEFRIGNIFDLDFDEIWNSKNAKKLRYSVCEGNFDYCTHLCAKISSLDKQQKVDKNFFQDPFKPREILEKRYSNYKECEAFEYPKYITLACDNTCNLRCPSCRCEIKKISNEKRKLFLDALNKKIKPLLKYCRNITMLTSGEFFASSLMKEFTKDFRAEKYPDLSLEIYSNAQLITPGKWQEYKNLWEFPLSFSISIDAATKETYEKLRLGGKYEILCQNMDFIAKLKREGKIQRLFCGFVVQRDNFREMEQFVERCKEWGATKVKLEELANWGAMTYQEFLSKSVCREDNKDNLLMREKLTEIMKKNENFILTNISFR